MSLVKYFLIWIIYFTMAKAIFLLYNFGLSAELSKEELWGVFRHGLIMDISTACYLLVFPALLFIFRFLLSAKQMNRIVFLYTVVLFFIVTCLQVLDLELYPHWGTRVSFTFVHYINDPASLRATISWKHILTALALILLLMSFHLFLYRKLFPLGIAPEGKTKWHTSLFHLVLTASLIIPIRGGFDTSPLNHSSVAFSSKLYVNQAATNYLWNFFKSVLKRKVLSNPCNYFPKEESLNICKTFIQQDTLSGQVQLIHSDPDKDPNVILIILESFSNKVLKTMGGLPGIAPNLDALIEQSTTFTNFYASGNRSDRGMSAILGGYPSLLGTSVMLYPEKMRSLTLLPEYFNRNNYHTSFYYGGDINFYNLRTLVLQSEYKVIISKDNFPAELGRMTKWGVPDGYLFRRAAEDLKSMKEPFMQTIYTISSHHPFDVPFSKIHGKTQEKKFLNSVAYTDSCLGIFIRQLRESPLWENTLLIVTSDHGALEPGSTSITDPATYRIPLVWGGGIVDSVQQIKTVTQQIDFGVTLINQLGWESDNPPFARNFFSSNPFAFYMHDEGWGYVTPEGVSLFNQMTNSYSKTPQNNQADLKFPKAYIQVLHEDFINR